MLKIKKLLLQNYAGFKSAEFNFARNDGTYKPINLFFGPNGCGKSSALQAINLLGQSRMFLGRDNDLLFRKLTYHPDYDPTLPHFAKYEHEMRIEGVFDVDGKDREIILSSRNGVEKNELLGSTNAVFIDADHPMNMKKFQIPSDRIDLFLDIASTVYGYPVSVDKSISTFETAWDGKIASYDKFNNGTHSGIKVDYFQDFIIDKGDVKVHFKSMSDGEKKIATLLRNLCDPVVIDRSDIVLVDNIEMHIYMARHARMINKLLTSFPEKQFIVTSHSPVLVGMIDPALGISVSSFVGDSYGYDCLFDVIGIKSQPLTI